MDWKTFLRKLLLPPVWVMTLLSIFSAGALIVIFVNGWEQTIPAYLAYVIAFYTLSVVCLFCIRVLPRRMRSIKRSVYSNPLGNRYLTDPVFRTEVGLYLSLGINILYIAIHLVSWFVNRSWWFVVLAGYYAILSVMWFLLARFVRRKGIGNSIVDEWKRSRSCACILLLVNLSLSGAVLMILYQNRGFQYHGILIYVMALYTFYTTIHAIVDMVKSRKLGSPILSTTKIVSLSAALVSMLNLETAMFSQFGQDMAVEYQRIFIILTGAGVSIAIITLSVLLIVSATKEIRSNAHGKQRRIL